MKKIASLTLMGLLLAVTQLAAQAPARGAYEFVESVGVCTHFDYTNTNYVQQFDSVKSLLHDIGVRYVRDRAGVHTDHGSQRCLELYNEYGIKNVAVFNARNRDKTLNTSAIDGMVSRAAVAPDMFAAFEGPNEYDNNHPDSDTTWAASLYAFQQLLYDKIKNHPNTLVANTPVLGPSTTFYQGVANMGDFSDVCDYYNIHAYPGAVGPSTPLDKYLVEVPKYNGDIGIYATETGYHTALERGPRPHYPINEASEAKYLPRLFMHYFRQGIVKTFSYEFLNLQDNPTNDNLKHNFGLVRYDLSKKPAYYAVKNMLTVLKDESDAYSTQALEYTLSGTTNDVEQLLLQKSDGTFYLVLWQDVSVWDREQQVEISNPEAALILTFHQPVLQSKVYLPYQESNPSAPLAPITVQDNLSSVEISVPDHVMIVEITPDSASAVPSPSAGTPIFEEDFTQGPYLDRWIINERDWLFGYRLSGVDELGYAVKPRQVANGEPLITQQSFSDSSYVIETRALGFKGTYQREFRLIFGQTDPNLDRGYVLRYQPPFLGNSTLTIGRAEGNFYDLTPLDDVDIVLDDEQIYGFRIARYRSGLIQVYLDQGDGYPSEPTLEVVDTAYPMLAHFGWGVVTQTAGEDFYVLDVNAYQTTTEKIINPENYLIDRIVVESSSPYEIAELDVGDAHYTDRPYTITALPTYLRGATFIKTANDDKALANANYLRVFATRPVIAYVAYDPRATQLPDWLSETEGWVKTEDRIGTTDPGTSYLELYGKVIPPGAFSPISLGGTLASPAQGAEMTYVVALVENPEQLAYEAEEATLSGAAVATTYPGYSGSGFVDFLNDGSPESIEWTIDIPASGVYSLEFTVAQGENTAPRPVRILLDGELIAEQALGPQEGWDQWRAVAPDVTTRLYSEGTHTVTLEPLDNSGPNVDLLVVKTSTRPDNTTARIVDSRPKMSAPDRLNLDLSDDQSSLEVYPNPAREQVTVQYASRAARIILFDLRGQPVNVISSVGGQAIINTTDLAGGVYLVRVQSEQGISQRKLLVKKHR